jgi:hypothetical protein
MAGASSSTTWGGGIGVNLNQPVGSTSAGTIAIIGYGIQYSLAMPAFPTAGMHLVVDDNGTDYCAVLSGTSGTVDWTSFNTVCWDPATGTALSGPPQHASHLNFQVTAGAEPATLSFCVTNLAYVCAMPGGACTENGNCCQSGSNVGPVGATCLSDDNSCHAACMSSSDCKSGCCIELKGVSFGACGTRASGETCLP